MDILRVNNLSKSFDGVEVLHQLTTSFQQGTVTTIIGPSGSGKSTFLRTLNQLEEIDQGQIYFHDQDLTKRDCDLNQVRTKIGMVFQSFYLFDHMSVIENCMIGQIKVLRRDKKQAFEHAMMHLESVGMAQFADRKASSLSGGQKQRVAIARTLSMDPEVILFDEPTSSLDPEMVGGVLEVMREIMTKDLTCIVVTHEMDFARQVSDRILFMDQGRLVVDGSVDDVFSKQDHERLLQFLKRFS